jgi:hypothetical protein
VNKASDMKNPSDGADNPSAATGERGDRGATASSPTQARISRSLAGQSYRNYSHPQANIGGLRPALSTSENFPCRQQDDQRAIMIKNTSARTPYDSGRSNDDYESENSQAMGGLVHGHSRLRSRLKCKPDERLAKRHKHPSDVGTPIRFTLASADDASREHLSLPQRPSTGSFPPNLVKAQVIFG